MHTHAAINLIASVHFARVNGFNFFIFSTLEFSQLSRPNARLLPACSANRGTPLADSEAAALMHTSASDDDVFHRAVARAQASKAAL
jgi:hypothetical protein